jgi:hypothetical protein
MSLYIEHVLKSAIFFALLLCASSAFAHAPIITVAHIPSFEYEAFPQEYAITGTIKHAQIQDVRDLTLFINGVQESIIAVPYAIGDSDPNVFSLPWTIDEAGSYTIQVKARHGVGGQTGSSTLAHVVVSYTVIVVEECPSGTVGTYPNCEEIVVPCDYPYVGSKPNCELPPCPLGTMGVFPQCTTPEPESCPTGYVGVYPECSVPQPQVCPSGYTGVYPVCILPVVLECPAAPSYAGAYLKFLGLKAGGKGFKNAVASVAHHMGPAKLFDGIHACSSEYKGAVEGYIDDLVALRLL